jgi:DNA-binding transcriptional regulator YdaS (Cro superfamily)
MTTSGKSLSVLETALLNAGVQKKIAYDLGISEGELSKQISNLRKAMPLIEALGLTLVDAEVERAMRCLLKEAL